MKVANITFHTAKNYGAVLQAFALQKAINHIGHTEEIINYSCPFMKSNDRIFRIETENANAMIASVLHIPFVIQRKWIFDKFLRQNCVIEENVQDCNCKKFLEELNEKFDIFIAGSDQIWNPLITGMDTTYLLDFVFKDHKKSAYAASFGLDEIDTQYMHIFKHHLQSFDDITVREESAQQIIQRLLNRDVSVVLDPTFLLTKEDWLKFSKPITTTNYILLYLLYKDDELINTCLKFAKKLQLKLIVLNAAIHGFGDMVINRRNVDPLRWISYFENANYVFTNSFHGVAFSVILNKQFFTKHLPPVTKVNGRINNLLNKLNLYDRLINTMGTDSLEKEVNYESVNKIINIERKYSFDCLAKMLGNS